MAKLSALELPPLDPIQRYTVDEACAYLRSSRAHLYKKISGGEIESLTDGNRRYVPGWAIAIASGARESDIPRERAETSAA